MSRAVEAGQIRRTQSGRCSIPPLARWAGQYMQRDDDGNITIGFASQAAEKHFAKMAEQELGAPVINITIWGFREGWRFFFEQGFGRSGVLAVG